MAPHVIIYAPNVGGGGGLVLLRALLGAEWQADRITAILDERGRQAIQPVASRIAVHWVSSTVSGRWKAEKLLASIRDQRSTTLCFHNLPPILRGDGEVLCYVQNANLVGLIPQARLRLWPRARTAVERAIARVFRGRVDRYIVQTPTMADALQRWHGGRALQVDIMPFHDGSASAADLGGSTREAGCDWDFLYVSDGSAHKNHHRLFAAWRLLAEQGVRPRLAVTLHPERDRALSAEASEMAGQGINIEDLGLLSHVDMLTSYSRARALIFPSYAESFGIPLIEAVQAGLPILAPELDYVRDVCEPAITFDARSARSIARAVSRFLGVETPPPAIMDADQFAAILSGGRLVDWQFGCRSGRATRPADRTGS